MKIPLRFQVTEYDCGSVSLLNVLSYLYDREEIPAILIKEIYKYTLDLNENDKIGEGGTSQNSVRNLIHWITRFTKENDFNISCQRLIGEEITLEYLKQCLSKNGCVLIRCYLEHTEHYVIITKISRNSVYIFDPYYLDKTYKSNNVKLVFNRSFSHNRKVNIKRFLSTQKFDFSLGPIDNRDCVLFNRK